MLIVVVIISLFGVVGVGGGVIFVFILVLLMLNLLVVLVGVFIFVELLIDMGRIVLNVNDLMLVGIGIVKLIKYWDKDIFELNDNVVLILY